MRRAVQLSDGTNPLHAQVLLQTPLGGAGHPTPISAPSGSEIYQMIDNGHDPEKVKALLASTMEAYNAADRKGPARAALKSR